MSSMRSASSMTRISTPVSSSLPRSKWSSRRPGVAISTSTPRSSLRVLVVERDAADQQRDVELVVDAVLSKFSSTCAASSRVGSRISVRGMRARARPVSSARQHRQHEGGGLAGAGLGDAQDVAAREHVGDGLFLDRGRRGVSRGCHRIQDLLREAKGIKTHGECYLFISGKTGGRRLRGFRLVDVIRRRKGRTPRLPDECCDTAKRSPSQTNPERQVTCAPEI